MTFNVLIMYAVALILTLVGATMLLRLASPRITERQIYAFRMTGIMLAAAGIVLAMSATAMWQWSMPA